MNTIRKLTIGTTLLCSIAYPTFAQEGFKIGISPMGGEHQIGVKADKATTAIQDAVNQNTQGAGMKCGNSLSCGEGLGWDTGDLGYSPAPSGWTAMIAWAVVYRETGKAYSAGLTAGTDTVTVQGFQTWLLINNSWVKVQDQAGKGLAGDHYKEDFSSNSSTPMKITNNSDGSTTLDAPPSGLNNHFWPNTGQVSFSGTVTGVFVIAQMKTNDPNVYLVGQLGGDWWKYAGASYCGTNCANTAIGESNWVQLSTNYQTLYFTNLNASQLTANPPPPLAVAPPPPVVTIPTVTLTSVGGPVSSLNQTITGTVDTADAGSTVTIMDSGSQLGTTTAAANGAWSASVTLPNQVSHVVTATVTNAAGAGVSNSVTYTYTPPAPPPPSSVPIISILNGNVTSTTGTFTVTTTPSASGCSITISP